MPNVFIHYFTGTCNTKHAIDVITNDLKQNGFEVKQFVIGKDKPVITENADFNIFAFSILSWSAPALVKRYLRRLPQGGRGKAAIFAVCAGDSGRALPEIERFLNHKHFDVFLTAEAYYPNNWAQMTNPPKAENINEILAGSDNQAHIFASSFIKGERKLHQSNLFSSLATGFSAFFFSLIGRRVLGKAYITDSNCNRCGLCVKSCPVHTIRMAGIIQKKPYWKFNCEDCNRCINICPNKAIQVSIPKLLFHLLIMIAGIWACFSTAGSLANRLPEAYRIIGWIAALIISVFIELWVQFTAIDRLFFILEQIPVVNKFFSLNFTKNYNRYIAPGFKPDIK